MDEKAVRESFQPYWMFQLFGQQRVPNGLLIAGISFSIWLVGAALALVLNVFGEFVVNLLAYMGPIWIGVTLAAYLWFTTNFPRMIEALADAFEDHDAFTHTVQTWGRRSGQKEFMIPLFLLATVVALLSRVGLYTTPGAAPFWAAWEYTPQKLFFDLYLNFNHVLALPLLLGSGLVTLLATALILRELLRQPLKLDYYRRLAAVSDISLGIALWTAFAIVNILIPSILFGGAEFRLDSASIAAVGQSLIGSLALLAIFLLPILMARGAVVRAKRRKLAPLEERLHALTGKIDAYFAGEFEIDGAGERREESEGEGEQPQPVGGDTLETYMKARDEIKTYIQEIDAVPILPVRLTGILPIVAAAATPTIGALLNLVLQTLSTA